MLVLKMSLSPKFQNALPPLRKSLISHNFCPYRREGEKRLTDHIGELKKQLAARDQMIQRLQKDLKGKDEVHISIQCFVSKERKNTKQKKNSRMFTEKKNNLNH